MAKKYIEFNLANKMDSSKQALEWLNASGVPNSELVLRLSRGSPLAASQLDEDQLTERKLLSKAFTATLNNEISIT